MKTLAFAVGLHHDHRRRGHHRPVGTRVDRPTIRHVWRFLCGCHRPHCLWGRSHLCGVGFPRAERPPRVGLCHSACGDRDGSDGSGWHRTRACTHRVVVRNRVLSFSAHERSSLSTRRARRLCLRFRSAHYLNKRLSAPSRCESGRTKILCGLSALCVVRSFVFYNLRPCGQSCRWRYSLPLCVLPAAAGRNRHPSRPWRTSSSSWARSTLTQT